MFTFSKKPKEQRRQELKNLVKDAKKYWYPDDHDGVWRWHNKPDPMFGESGQPEQFLKKPKNEKKNSPPAFKTEFGPKKDFMGVPEHGFGGSRQRQPYVPQQYNTQTNPNLKERFKNLLPDQENTKFGPSSTEGFGYVYRPRTFKEQFGNKIPKEGLIHDGGFVSPTGKCYVLEGHIRHAEWIMEHYNWLKSQGYDLHLEDEDYSSVGRHDVRAKLIELGWLRVRFEGGFDHGVITCLDPVKQFPLIEKFFKENPIKNLEDKDLHIEDLDGKEFDELVNKIIPMPFRDFEKVFSRVKIYSGYRKKDGKDIQFKNGSKPGMTILFDPNPDEAVADAEGKIKPEIIASIGWTVTGKQAVLDEAEIRRPFKRKKFELRTVLENSAKHYLEQLGFTIVYLTFDDDFSYYGSISNRDRILTAQLSSKDINIIKRLEEKDKINLADITDNPHILNVLSKSNSSSVKKHVAANIDTPLFVLEYLSNLRG